MKALLTVIFSLILSVIFIAPCNSQDRFRCGTYSVGGGIWYSQENYKYVNSEHNKWSISIKPRISYFVADNISCDLQLGFGHHDDDVGEYEDFDWEWQKYEKVNSDLSIGFGNSFYLPLENTYPFIRTGIAYCYKFITSINRKIDDETIINASLGLAVFISNSVAIEPELGYDYGLWSNKDYKKNIFWFSFGIKYYVYEFGLE